MNEFEEYNNECWLAKIETALTFIQDETIKKEIQEFAKNDGETILLGVLDYINKHQIFSASKYRHNIYEYFCLVDNHIIQNKIEKREEGIIYTKIKKTFGKSFRFPEQTVLTDLVENRYVYRFQDLENLLGIDGKNLSFDDFYSLFIQSDILEDQYYCVSSFVSNMNYYVPLDLRWLTDNIYPTRTYINGKDVSSLFVIDGPDKLYRIYDLYHGLINDRNIKDLKGIHLGLLSPDIYDYKSLIGITRKENRAVGQPREETKDIYYSYLKETFKEQFNYKGPIKLNREFILNIIIPNVEKEDLTEVVEDKFINSEKKDQNILKKVLKHLIK